MLFLDCVDLRPSISDQVGLFLHKTSLLIFTAPVYGFHEIELTFLFIELYSFITTRGNFRAFPSNLQYCPKVSDFTI